MIRLLARIRPALRVAALLALAWIVASGVAVAQEPPPEKLEQLIDILADPAVRDWLQRQSQVPRPAAASEASSAGATSLLSTVLASIKQQARATVEAFQRMPAQFERAKNILMIEFQHEGVLGILALIAVFIAAGFGADKLARWLLRGYLAWMKTLPNDAPRARLRFAAARALYSLIMIAAFIVGSAGVFLVFNWPPLMREIVLGYLSVAILARIVLMLGRTVLMPPFLGLPNPAEVRLVPMSDARATHWYVYSGLITAWFAFAGVTLALLGTFGFDRPGRTALGIPASFVLLLLFLAAVWLRPVDVVAVPRRISPRTMSWLLTGYFVALWLLWTIGAYTAFWLVFAVVALPAAIAATKSAVHYVLRPPEEGSGAAAFPPVTIAVIDRGVRVCLIVVAAYFLVRALGLDIASFTQGDSLSVRLLRGSFNAVIIVLAADFGWTVAKALIARKLGEGGPATGHGAVSAHEARLRTLLPIFQNILFAVILVMAVLMILSSLGIEIAPLIAGAGVVGVAIGFGAQTLVKDVISGMFYLLDDAFRVGEYIESGSHKGTVESFSLRSVKLRHHRGYLATVPFGELGAVQNMSRDWVVDKFNITVGFNTDIEKCRKLIKKLGQELAVDPEFAPHIIEPLKMQGVQSFGDYGIEIRMKMMTKPGEQFPIRRKAWVKLKQLFEQNGIEIPFPTVHVKGGGGSPAEAAAIQSVIAAKPVPAA